MSPIETPRPTETPRPAETLRPTETPRPAETLRPTETPRPVQTSRPVETTRFTDTPRAGTAPARPQEARPGASTSSSMGSAPDHGRDTVFVVDDDEAVRDSLRWLLDANGFEVRAFDSAESFLEGWAPSTGGCLILDVRMPGMSGLALQDELLRRGASLPIVFITGHGDVPMAVESMKKGAIDFLEKPFSDADLCDTVRGALERARSHQAEAEADRKSAELLSRLTVRERQVLDRIVAGRLNKQIADDLGISIKTVEAHRANIMEKLQARSMADLMKVALRAA